MNLAAEKGFNNDNNFSRNQFRTNLSGRETHEKNHFTTYKYYPVAHANMRFIAGL
jgi:hypothetical protein